MKTKLRYHVAWITGALVGAALLGGNATASNKSTSNGTVNKLVVAESTAPKSFDPTQSDVIASWYPWALVYDSLVRVITDGSLAPVLATKWSISDDRLTYTFQLRRGVKFQNGDALTADDVVFSYQRMLTGGIPYTKARFPTLVSIEATGALEVQFKLSAADAGFLNNLGDPFEVGTAVLSKKAASATNPATMMMGTGPYKMVSYVPDQKLTLVSNDKYWGVKPKTKNLEILYMPDQSAQVAALRSGKIDLMFPTAESLRALSGSHTVTKNVQSATIVQLEFNSEFNPALAKLQVREAIAHAIDRKGIVSKALLGAGVPSAHLPSALAYAVAPKDLPNYTYDPALSRRLLAEAGYANGLDLTLDVFSTAPPLITSYAEVLQSQLKAVGINVTIINSDFATWLSKFNGGKFALLANWTSYKSDPIWYLHVRPGRSGTTPSDIAAMETKIQGATQKELPSLLQVYEKLQAASVWPNLAIAAETQSVTTRLGVTGVNPQYQMTRSFLGGVTVKKIKKSK
jgi:ABC-type transport system substrate-binding protein